MVEVPCADDDMCGHGEEEYFGDYNPQTVDPGPTLLIATLIFCVLMSIALCVLIIVRNLMDAQARSNLEETEEASNNEGDETGIRKGRKVERVVDVKHVQFTTTEGKNNLAVTDGKNMFRDEENGRSIVSQESINYESSTSSYLKHQSLNPHSLRTRRHRRLQRAARMLEGVFKESAAISQHPSDPNVVIKETSTFSTHGDDNSGDTKPDDDKYDDAISSSSSSSSSSASVMIEEGFELDGGFYDTLLDIAEWDAEMKRLFKLGVPFALQALCTGILEIVTTAVIGKLLGTRELAAFVVSAMCIEFTADLIGGVHEALTTLCSQAIGVGNNFLAGQYVQLSFLLYILISIPFAIIWWIYMVPVMLWFGFDDETAIMGRDYSRILIFDLFIIEGLGESIHGLLDVAEREGYSTIIGVTEEVLALVSIVLIAKFGEQPTLMDIGFLEMGLGILFLGFNIIYITWKGWFRPFYKGMLRSFSFYNTKAVWLMVKTSTSLTLGLLLTEAEWEIFGIYASFLGPAEVATWGILGTIWAAVEALIESIGDAAEVRAAFLLGTGQYKRAKVSAYKSILISLYVASFLSSGLYICGEDLPLLITNDETLQYLLADMLPLTGLGFIFLTMGSVCWTLIGAQGRYHMATLFVIIGSCVFTMPLGAVFSIVLKLNLQGQIAAIIVGYVLSGSANTYLLFRTDWCEVSKRVIEENSSLDDDSSSSDSSDSCSCSVSTSSDLNSSRLKSSEHQSIAA